VAELQPIPLSWPFAQWGLNMVGKLHKSWPGGHVYMLVAVDKFTKWVEAAPVTTQDSTAAINFIKSIVFHFGVPYIIITDNGTNFTSKEFKSYCEGLGIKLKFASVAHPKMNGQVEKANGLICNGIKKEAFSTSRKIQAHLGRRIALRALESKNYTQCRYSRNSFFLGPWCRRRASSRSHTRSSKSNGIR
jgi:transposase InsO family protein